MKEQESNRNKMEPYELFLQKTVGNSELRKEILNNGRFREASLNGIKQDLDEFDSQATGLLIRTLLANLVNGAVWNQDQRDCALQILPLINLGAIEPETLAKYFSASLKRLKDDADPYGEIDAILQTGKIIAPYIAQHRIMIGRNLRSLSAGFREDEEAYAYISDIEKEIGTIMLPPLNATEASVKVLAVEGLSDPEISTRLKIPSRQVAYIRHKLNQRQEIPPRSTKHGGPKTYRS